MTMNILSRTKLKVRIRKKTKPELAAALALAIKNPNWSKLVKVISMSTRKHASVNLNKIDKQATTGDSLIVIGKVLSVGEITKKVRIISFSISEPAKEKLKKTKSDWVSVLDEIKANPKAEGLKFIK